MLEESEQQAAWRRGRDVSSGQVPYQPRTGPYFSGDRRHPAQGEGTNQFQEQLGKFAESMWEKLILLDSKDITLKLH